MNLMIFMDWNATQKKNVYASLRGKKIEKIDQNLERSIYVENLLLDKTSQILRGPAGEIYYLNGVRFLLKYDPSVGDDALFAQLPGNAWDLDFDSRFKYLCRWRRKSSL